MKGPKLHLNCGIPNREQEKKLEVKIMKNQGTDTPRHNNWYATPTAPAPSGATAVTIATNSSINAGGAGISTSTPHGVVSGVVQPAQYNQQQQHHQISSAGIPAGSIVAAQPSHHPHSIPMAVAATPSMPVAPLTGSPVTHQLQQPTTTTLHTHGNNAVTHHPNVVVVSGAAAASGGVVMAAPPQHSHQQPSTTSTTANISMTNEVVPESAAATTSTTTASEDILQEALSSINFEFEGEDSKPDLKPDTKLVVDSSSSSSSHKNSSSSAPQAPDGDTIFSPAFLTVSADNSSNNGPNSNNSAVTVKQEVEWNLCLSTTTFSVCQYDLGQKNVQAFFPLSQL